MSSPALSFRAQEIVKSFSGVTVLHGVDFEIRPGRIHGLFGHNGAGKSTLLKVMAGVHDFNSGGLFLGDRAVRLHSPRDALSQGIACVYQELRLIPHLTVAQNIFLGREPSVFGLKREKEMRARTEDLLAEYGLSINADEYVRDLSHPHKQMIEIIASLDRNARFLFLDEPTTALEGRRAEELLRAVKRIATEKEVGFAIVTHKIDEVLGLCDEVTVLTGGRVVHHVEGRDIDKKNIVHAIIGKETDGADFTRSPRKSHSASADLTGLRVRGLRTRGLKGIDLEARSGEVLGLYGLVGSGRTRFCRTLYGLEKIVDGEILLDGKPYVVSGPMQAMRQGVAYLTEERKRDGFIPQMSVVRNIVLPVLNRFKRLLFLNGRKAESFALEILGRFRTQGNLTGPMQALSGGNQQKALFGRIIAQDAALILLDEPTKGVDIGAKAEIYEVINSLSASGKCVIVVSSEEEELLQIADRIAVFKNGSCTEEALPAEDFTVEKLRLAAWPTEKAYT